MEISNAFKVGRIGWCPPSAHLPAIQSYFIYSTCHSRCPVSIPLKSTQVPLELSWGLAGREAWRTKKVTPPSQSSPGPRAAMLLAMSLAYNQLKDTKASPESSLHRLSGATDVHKIIYNRGTWPIRNLDGPKHKPSALLRKSKHEQCEIWLLHS